MTDIVQIVDADGNSPGSSATWFPPHESMESEALTFISILGAQASGKSTLLNALFGTNFSVASRSALATATTKGISAALDTSSSTYVILDVEGSDSRERGRDGRLFHSKLASYVTAISDAIIINIWYHDVGRYDAAGYSLLGDIFAEALRLSKTDSTFKTRLIFTLRDVDVGEIDVDSLKDVLYKDVDDLFSSKLEGEDDTQITQVSDLFDLTFSPFPHMKHNLDGFNEDVTNLAEHLEDVSSDDALLKTENSKGIPADSSASFMRGLWGSQYASEASADPVASRATTATDPASTDNAAPTTSSSLMAAFKCNEAFSQALSEASQAMKQLTANTLDSGEKVEDLGKQFEEIMTTSIAKYEELTEEYKDDISSIESRKKHELKQIIDTQQKSIFMKQIQLIRENALTHFKSITTSDDTPSDLAFYTADSQFIKESELSKRADCSWNIDQERIDLHNMMQEISTQRKKLLTSQVTAAQHQAHALQYLQMQQSQMNAIQSQAYGNSGAGQWNLGAAYRPPDTNINASLSYQQGRTNIQISMVPDESASLLGPNGFTSGVGPGNLGLSFNIGL